MAAAPLEKTRTPGIFKRGGRYVVPHREPGTGKQRWPSFPTFEEARRFKRNQATDVDRGEYVAESRQTLHELARDLFGADLERPADKTPERGRYQGGRRGFRDDTRDDYRRMLEGYALRFFDARLRVSEVTPRHVAQFIAWLCDEEAQGRRLSDKTVRNVLGPLRACLATARREGLIRHNAVDGAQLPHRPQVEDDDDQEDARALGRDELAMFLRVLAVRAPRHVLLFRLLAATGLRISEAIGLQWRHVVLDGDRPHVKVRRRIVRGKVGPPKSRHSRRDVPLPASLVDELRAWQRETEWPGRDDLVFATTTGTAQNKDNLRNRYLRPAAEEAGAAWCGLHTFRHTFASLHIARGTNVVQLAKLLGHHSPAFTLSVYSHLLDDGVGAALDIDAELRSANTVQTSAAFGGVRPGWSDALEPAD